MDLRSAIRRAPLGPMSGSGWTALVANASDASPYLARLAADEAEWLEAAAGAPPGRTMDELIEAARAADGDPSDALRRAKRRAALLVALADLGGAWGWAEVTCALTRFADAALAAATRHALAREAARGRLPDDPGYVALAMGKMGAGELNYSSDIDLICLFDQSRHAPSDYAAVRQGCIRATREIVRVLSEPGPGGYVFRTDLRLRPDPASTPVCLSMDAAERYYESLGRTWERAAHIKARPAAGDLEAGAAYLAALAPFVWRRHLDFAAVEDAQEMGRRIRQAHGGGGPIEVAGHDLKLGPGGIRAAEFAAQTPQLIFGGRDEALRVPRTVDALAALSRAGRMAETDAADLSRAYGSLRNAEHRIQMIRDAQTHTVPADPAEMARVAALCGETPSEFSARIGGVLRRVHEITGDLMGESQPAPRAAPPEWRPVLERWAGYPALKSERARRGFERIAGEIASRVDASARPDETLRALDGFLSGLPAGAQLFALFEANPQLMDLIVDIAGTAPGLAAHLSRNAGVLDAVIGGGVFGRWPDAADLTEGLRSALAREEDYEGRLGAARVWASEARFGIGVQLLRGLIGAAEAGRRYAQVAEAVLRAILPEVEADVARRHGRVPGARLCVLGMGSLGAGWLHGGSDLDLIVIYDAAGTSDGKRPLDARAWAGKIAQTLITALSAQMARGRLYEVDMRLRPSGRQGPVATSWPAFESYQREKAWTWEHLALTRGRPVAGEPGLGDEIERFRRALVSEVGVPGRVAEGLADMRRRLAEARPRQGPWDMRAGPGGLHDIELLGQARALVEGSAERRTSDQLGQGAALEAYLTQRAIRAATSLVAPAGFDPETCGAGATGVVLREAGAEDAHALLARLDEMRDAADEEARRQIDAWSA